RAFFAAVVPRVVAFILGFGSSEWEEMRSAASLHVTEATGDLRSIDEIKTNYSSVHHNFDAGFRRIFRVTQTQVLAIGTETTSSEANERSGSSIPAIDSEIAK